MVQKEENNHIISEAEIEINERHLIHTDTQSKSAYNWNAVTNCVEANNCFYLYLNSMQAVIIPKRVLSSAEITDLRKFLDEKIPLASSFRSIGI